MKRAALVLLAAALGGAAPCFGQVSHRPFPVVLAGPRAPAAAMAVTREPESGVLRPATPRELAATRAGTPAAVPGSDVTVVHLPDGSKMVDVGDRFMSFAVARRSAGFRLEIRCLTEPGQARVPPPPGPQAAAFGLEER